MENNVNSIDKDISFLFDKARNKLEKLDLQSKQLKKQIIKDLALALEGKISIDSICIEIVNQLRGQVSDRFIRECLDEKYKQKTRMDNAKKQVIRIKDAIKREGVKEKVVNELAVLPPLKYQANESVEENDETKENKSKQVVMVSTTTSDRTLFSETAEEKNSIIEDNLIVTKPFEANGKPSVFSFFSKEQYANKLNKKYLEECPSCKELYYENCQLKEILQKSGQLIILAENLYRKESLSHPNDKVKPNSYNDLMIFEFSKTFGEIREHMAPLYGLIGDNELIWFNGKVDRHTGKTVHSRFGRLSNIQPENNM